MKLGDIGMHGATITGRLVSGIGQGQHFTRLDWARRQFMERLGIDPYPGTINLKVVEAQARTAWEGLRELPGVPITNPNDGPHDCDARCYLVRVAERFEAAIVVPEVGGYPPDAIEIICAAGLREALGLKDGDDVTITVV